MFLTSPTRTLEVSFRVTHGENSYMVYASTESLRCYECSNLGHKSFACPNRDDQRPSTSTASGAGLQRNDESEQRSVEQGEGVTEEVKRQEEVSENSVNAGGGNVIDVTDRNILQSGAAVADDDEDDDEEDDDIMEMYDGKKGVIQEVNDGAQAGDSEENTVDELEGLSQFTEDAMREGEQDSDRLEETGEDLYTVEEINAFLDKTKGKAGVDVGNYFPDIEKFVKSVMKARKVSSYEELSQQKRFRLKKQITAIRQNRRSGRITRGNTKHLGCL